MLTAAHALLAVLLAEPVAIRQQFEEGSVFQENSTFTLRQLDVEEGVNPIFSIETDARLTTVSTGSDGSGVIRRQSRSVKGTLAVDPPDGPRLRYDSGQTLVAASDLEINAFEPWNLQARLEVEYRVTPGGRLEDIQPSDPLTASEEFATEINSGVDLEAVAAALVANQDWTLPDGEVEVGAEWTDSRNGRDRRYTYEGVDDTVRPDFASSTGQPLAGSLHRMRVEWSDSDAKAWIWFDPNIGRITAAKREQRIRVDEDAFEAVRTWSIQPADENEFGF